METITNTETYQLRLLEDAAIDDARTARVEWQRALDRNLHALQDYVHPHQLIVWQPGERKRGPKSGHSHDLDVQLASATACTCQRFRLWDRCPHTEFAKRLEAAGALPDACTPVSALEVQ